MYKATADSLAKSMKSRELWRISLKSYICLFI